MDYVICETGDAATAYLAGPARWLAASIDQTIGWPDAPTLIQFRGHKVVLLPKTEKTNAAVATRTSEDFDWKSGRRLLLEFAGALAWGCGGQADLYGWSEASYPNPTGRRQTHTGRVGSLRATYLPEPKSREARLAMANFREASALDHVGYAFLSYFKVINIAYQSWKNQVEWIKEVLPQIRDARVQERVKEIEALGEEPALYLYTSGRCAVAHAHDEPIADPDDVDDHWRLYADLPVIREIAKATIELKFGVKTSDTIYREHLYNLAGFKELLGAELAAQLAAKATLPRRRIKLPAMALRIGGQPKYERLESLAVRTLRAIDGIVHIECRTPRGNWRMRFALDFPSEALHYDALEGMQTGDNGSAEAAFERADGERFFADLLRNGELELWNAETSEILGRCDPCMPVNLMLNPEGAKAAIDHWQRVGNERAESAGSDMLSTVPR